MLKSFRTAVLILIACLPPPAVAAELEPEDLDGGGFADSVRMAEMFRPHCVRVYLWTKSNAGILPTTGTIAEDVRNQRPTRLGGYWWDRRRVVVEDPVLPDAFIREAEIGLPGSDRRFPARVAGRFAKIPALLLEVLPDASGERPRAFPLWFSAEDVLDENGEAFTLRYHWDDGEWMTTIDSSPAVSAVDDSNREFMEATGGILFSGKGEVLGLTFGERLPVGDGNWQWLGPEIRKSRIIHAGAADRIGKRIDAMLETTILETRFSLRFELREDEEEPEWLSGSVLAGASEAHAAGLAVARRRLLVPLPLPPRAIAHIDRITVVTGNGSEILARFAGAFRDYQAVLLETDADLPGGDPPPGFAALDPQSENPLEDIPYPASEFIHRRRVDYESGRRRMTADYDRVRGQLQGYRDEPVVFTWTNEKDGSLAFDADGNLTAVALTPRLAPGHGEYEEAEAGFRPLAFLARSLRRPDRFDPAVAPVSRENGRRLIDSGVEYQPLDANTAKLFFASEETRGGQIGLLITHVYPGFPLAAAGLREQDIILRLFVEGRTEPVELRDQADTWLSAFSLDSDAELLEESPELSGVPWPPRNNAISNLLTAAGVGRRIEVEYLRDGKLRQGTFVSSYGEPDFQNAEPDRFPAIGIDVKPVTYEVARYFGRPDQSGVIVSRVREGSRAGIAGLCRYLLITHADGRKIRGLADFQEKITAFEKGRIDSTELTVEFFGRTRLVRLR